jgi:hypothetical protein
LARLLDPDKEPCQPSNLAIRFNEMAFGDSTRQIKKVAGRPVYRIDNSDNISGHEKLFYRLNFGAFKAVSQLHFLNDEFFLGQIFFNHIDQSKLVLTKDLIIQKYYGRPAEDQDNFVFCDQNKNMIKVSNESFGIIHYISGDPRIREFFLSEIEAKQNKALALEELNRRELFSLL